MHPFSIYCGIVFLLVAFMYIKEFLVKMQVIL